MGAGVGLVRLEIGESTMEIQTNTTRSNESERLVDSLVGIGAEWAVFGLQVATSALERSARSMRLAARSLGTIARAIEPKVTREGEPEGSTTEPAEPTVTADPSKL